MTTDLSELVVGRVISEVETTIGWFLTIYFDNLVHSRDYLWIQQAGWRVVKDGIVAISCIDYNENRADLDTLLVGRMIMDLQSDKLGGLTMKLDDGSHLDVMGLDHDVAANWCAFIGKLTVSPLGQGLDWCERTYFE